MGIDPTRFVGKQHELFKCPVCLDVADDPVTINPCDHITCKSCLNYLTICPQCFMSVQGQNPISSVLKNVYESLPMKCSFEACNEVFNLENYKAHEKICAKSVCQQCGFYKNYDHSCIQSLQDKVVALKLENGQLTTEVKILTTEVKGLRTRLSSSGIDRYTGLPTAGPSGVQSGVSSSRTLSEFIRSLRVPCTNMIPRKENYYLIKNKAICKDCMLNESCRRVISDKLLERMLKKVCVRTRQCKCPCSD